MKKTGNEMVELLGKVGMNFIELSAELGNATYYYSSKEVLERYKTGITPYIFKNMDEYKDFLAMLEEFLNEFKAQLVDRSGGGLSASIKKAWSLKEKYPEQFDKLVLLHVSLERDNPYIINASRKILKDKDVTVEHFCEKSGLKSIMIATTQEFSSDFLGKELNERGKLEVSLRKYTKDEKSFLNNDDMLYAIADLLPQDMAYCAKDERYASSLIYNLNCYMEYLNQNKKNIDINALIFFMFNNVQFLDLNKLRTVMLYRMIQNQTKGIYVQKMMEAVKGLKNVNVNMSEIDTEIFDSSCIEFEHRFASQENTRILFLSHGSELKKKSFSCEEEKSFTSNDVLQMAREYLDREEFRRFFESKDKIVVRLYSRNVHLLKEELERKIRSENSELPEKEIQEIIRKETEETIKTLIDMRKMDINLAISFDENVALDLISSGEIKCSDDNLKNLSLENIFYISRKNSEYFLRFLNKGLISADEVMSLNDVTLDMVLNLLDNNYITIEELGFLVSKNKLDVSRLNLNLETVLDEVPDILAKLYIKIAQKRIEYDKETLDRIEKSEDEELPLSIKEQYLKSELQQLINEKNVYVNLVNSVDLNSKQRLDFSENLFLGALEKTDDLYGEFLISIQEMYKDGLVTIDQIRDLDSKLFMDAIKSGVIQAYDIRENILSQDEIDEIESSSESEEKKKEELEQLRYLKLEEIAQQIIKDSSLSQEEKLGIIYNMYILNTQEEKEYRSRFEEEILGNIDGKFSALRENYPKNSRKKKAKPDIEKGKTKSENANNYVYPTYVIWQFMGMLDPKMSIQTFSDGNVVFSSKKLNKAIIESVWTNGENGLQRSYGTVTTCMDLNTFKENESSIIVRGRKGYRINILEAKNALPIIETPKGPRRKGIVRHSKDLGHSGRKIWFEILLENLGVELENGKDTRYTKDDLEVIKEFIKMARTSYERV